METLHTLGRHSGPRGDVVLRRRSGAGAGVGVGVGVEELIVNGVFAMDSADTETERRLAQVALAGPEPDRALPGVDARAAGVPGGRPPGSATRALVGGLGLGYTAAALLVSDIEHLDVVEIEECLVEWAYAGLTPTLGAVARDPRVALHAVDVAAVLTGRRPEAPGPWDAIVLDVDNGPDFLIHQANAGLYTPPLLAAAFGRLTDGGTLAIWSQGPAPQLLDGLRRLSPTARAHSFPRVRDGRSLDYVIYTVRRAAATVLPAEQECGS